MLESDWPDEHSEVFSGKRKENVVPGSSLDHIAWPYHFAQMMSVISTVLQQKNN